MIFWSDRKGGPVWPPSLSIMLAVIVCSLLCLIIKSNIDADQARRLTTEASR